MTNETRYPISEIFTSLQGEGLYSGTPMTFIRFAGCSVGRPVPEAKRGLEPAYRETCHAWDGRSFLCDTDFRRKMVLSLDQLLAEVPVTPQRVCFTGGEPLNHDLSALAYALCARGQLIQIETSGTIEFPSWAEDLRAWITVSPKAKVILTQLSKCHELKLLVDSDFNLEYADALVRWCGTLDSGPLIWVQPINTEWELDRSHLAHCLEILRQRPAWRLSSQLHKVWKVR